MRDLAEAELRAIRLVTLAVADEPEQAGLELRGLKRTELMETTVYVLAMFSAFAQATAEASNIDAGALWALCAQRLAQTR
jgi:hypothetical protein